jgi:hypothetical protein
VETNGTPANGTSRRGLAERLHLRPVTGDHRHLSPPGLDKIPQQHRPESVIYDVKLGNGRWHAPPGTILLSAAALLLLGLAAAQGYVSWFAQFAFIDAAKHAQLPSALEAIGLDSAAVIFALLGLAHARMGRPAVIERALNLACAFGSMTMNLLGADLTSPRSVAVYVLPALLYAATSDRLIAVAGHQAGVTETSLWHYVGVVFLYVLRFALAFPSTWGGLRRRLLQMTPLPDAGKPRTRPVTSTRRPRPPASSTGDATQGRTPPAGRGPSKKSVFLALYEEHPDRGDRAKAAAVAEELAPRAGLQPGTGRTYLVEWFADHQTAAS